MAEIIGTAASLLQLVGTLSQGLTTLRNACVAVRDVHKRIEDILDRVNKLQAPVQSLHEYIQSRAPTIESELPLHDVIRDVTKSCLASLRMIQGKLPALSSSKKKVVTAIKLWIHDRDIEQARKHIDGSLESLQMMMTVLHLYVAYHFVCATANGLKIQSGPSRQETERVIELSQGNKTISSRPQRQHRARGRRREPRNT